MNIQQIESIGPWSCPLCGSYSSHGLWARLHFQGVHGMTEKAARAVLVRSAYTLAVVAPVAVPVVPAPSAVPPRGQLDLFDKRVFLVG